MIPIRSTLVSGQRRIQERTGVTVYLFAIETIALWGLMSESQYGYGSAGHSCARLRHDYYSICCLLLRSLILMYTINEFPDVSILDIAYPLDAREDVRLLYDSIVSVIP